MDERTLLLMNWYNSLSAENKRALARFLNDEKCVSDIEKKIDSQTNELSSLIKKETSFTKDLVSNILGNYISDFSIYIMSKLLRVK